MTAAPPWAELGRRLAVTAAAILTYLLATKIPLYGVSPVALEQIVATVNYGSAMSRLSIGALGMTPLFSAICIAELLRLVGPRRPVPPSFSSPGWVLWLALAFATLQAGGVASALEQVNSSVELVPEPGSTFRIACVGSMVAATALFWWLASQITRNGLGSGFWVLFLAPFLVQLPGEALALSDLLHAGRLAATDGLLIGGFALATIGFAAFVYRTNDNRELGPAVVWPIILASTAITLVLTFTGFLLVWQGTKEYPAWIEDVGLHRGPLGIAVAVAALGLAIYLRYGRITPPFTSGQYCVLAAGLIAIALIGWIAMPIVGSALTHGPNLLILSAVTLEILRDWRAMAAPGPERVAY